MGACEEMGRIADTLVGGMMFHSEHADLMRLVGIRWLASLHEDGYEHDAKAYRKARRLCIDHMERMCPTGDQRRPEPVGKAAQTPRQGLSAQDMRQLVKTSLEGWAAWESSAAKAYADASVSLVGNDTLYRWAKRLQRAAEAELAEVRSAISELSSCNWDIVHAYEMGGEQ